MARREHLHRFFLGLGFVGTPLAGVAKMAVWPATRFGGLWRIQSSGINQLARLVRKADLKNTEEKRIFVARSPNSSARRPDGLRGRPPAAMVAVAASGCRGRAARGVRADEKYWAERGQSKKTSG